MSTSREYGVSFIRMGGYGYFIDEEGEIPMTYNREIGDFALWLNDRDTTFGAPGPRCRGSVTLQHIVCLLLSTAIAALYHTSSVSSTSEENVRQC